MAQAPLKPSPQLAEILGSPAPISRPQVAKKVWAYIKTHKLPGEVFNTWRFFELDASFGATSTSMPGQSLRSPQVPLVLALLPSLAFDRSDSRGINY
jgi:hypothetical protein